MSNSSEAFEALGLSEARSGYWKLRPKVQGLGPSVRCFLASKICRLRSQKPRCPNPLRSHGSASHDSKESTLMY